MDEQKAAAEIKEGSGLQSPESIQLLEKLVKNSTRQVRYARIAAFFTMGMFVAIVVLLYMVIPPTLSTLQDTRDTLNSAAGSLKDIDQMTASITRTSEEINTLVVQNSTKLTNSVQKISEIDFDGINKAITDLQTAVDPLAEAMRNLAAIFGR